MKVKPSTFNMWPILVICLLSLKMLAICKIVTLSSILTVCIPWNSFMENQFGDGVTHHQNHWWYSKTWIELPKCTVDWPWEVNFYNGFWKYKILIFPYLSTFVIRSHNTWREPSCPPLYLVCATMYLVSWFNLTTLRKIQKFDLSITYHANLSSTVLLNWSKAL